MDKSLLNTNRLFDILSVSVLLSSCVLASSGTYAQDEYTAITQMSVGMEYTSGDYGQSQNTDILYVPFSLKYDAFPWSVKLTVPYIRITGPGNVVGGVDGGVVIGDSSKRRTTEQGMGDTVASVTYALDTWWNTAPIVDLTAKAKIATADEARGLGTGENDYSLQVDIANTYGNTTPFLMVGYKFMGDPEDIDLNNVWFGSVGLDYRLHPLVNVGLSFDTSQATSLVSEDPKELVGYMNWKITKTFSVMGYGVLGFSDGSPDNGLGFQMSYRH